MRDDAVAFDLVQEAMLKLTEKYSDRSAAELPVLFHRILQNAIRDHYRRQKVRMLWTSPLSALAPGGDEEGDPLETFEAESNPNEGNNPVQYLERMQVVALIEQALEALPARQRQAFLLRYWENMDVAETAAIMGCTEGSVKTHCSRATHALAAMLKGKGIEP